MPRSARHPPESRKRTSGTVDRSAGRVGQRELDVAATLAHQRRLQTEELLQDDLVRVSPFRFVSRRMADDDGRSHRSLRPFRRF